MSYEKSAHLYDLFDQKDNIEFFFRYTSRVGEVLDVGAGTGRIAIPLAEQGVRLCCVEPSPAMRRVFEKKLATQPELVNRIQLVAGNAASFSIDRSFPLALLSRCFDHFLDDRERRASLLNIGSHLTPGGILLFDVFLGLMGNRQLSPAGKVRLGNRMIHRMVGAETISAVSQCAKLVYEIYEGETVSERIEESGLVGVIDRQDIHRVLRESGFEIKQEWGGYDFSTYKEENSLLIVEAVKKGTPDK
jgi:SAM-dependent methyltransferase